MDRPYLSKGLSVPRMGIAALAAILLVLGVPLSAAASPAKPAVSFTVDVRSPQVGDPVTAKGVVADVPRSTPVQIQRHTRSGWHRVAGGLTGGKGKFTATFIASGLAKESLRAVVAATRSLKAAVSATRTITVYDWFPLDDVTPTKITGEVALGAQVVLGTAQSDVVVFGPGTKSLRPNATWELDRVCTDFRSNVVWDETTTGRDTLHVFADGVSRATATVSIEAGVAADLHHARFLKLETDGVAGVANQRAAWTSADVLCTEDPADV